MRNNHVAVIAALLFISMGAATSARSQDVAGIALPTEDDVLIQMLLDDQVPMEERTELINETLNHIYPNTLPAEERSRGLMRLVKRDDAPLELRYLAAATMDVAGVAPPELGEYLVAECMRDDISPEWLSFCLRQLDLAYLRGTADIKVAIVEILTTSARRERGDIAGTALLALWRISESDDDALPALRTLNRALLSTKDNDLDLMIAALQVAGSLGDSEALPIAKRLAYSDKYGIRLRLAAVNAILSLGSPEEMNNLAKLRADRDIGTAAGSIIDNWQRQQ